MLKYTVKTVVLDLQFEPCVFYCFYKLALIQVLGRKNIDSIFSKILEASANQPLPQPELVQSIEGTNNERNRFDIFKYKFPTDGNSL